MDSTVRDLTSGDLDADGVQDLIVARDTLDVLFLGGTEVEGEWVGVEPLGTVPLHATTLDTWDWTGNGLPDLVAGNGAVLSAFTNRGADGAFSMEETFNEVVVGAKAEYLRVGMLESEELFTVGYSGAGVSVWAGPDGSGNLGPRQELFMHDPGLGTRGGNLVDVTGDGAVDLVAAAGVEGTTLVVYRGDGQGAFAAPREYDAGFAGLDSAVADLNGDEIADVIVVGRGVDWDAPFPNHTDEALIAVLLGDDNGDLSLERVEELKPGGGGRSVAVANLDDDDALEIVVSVTDDTAGGTEVGGLHFLELTDTELAPLGPGYIEMASSKIAVVDLDGDGHRDIVTGAGGVTVLWGCAS